MGELLSSYVFALGFALGVLLVGFAWMMRALHFRRARRVWDRIAMQLLEDDERETPEGSRGVGTDEVRRVEKAWQRIREQKRRVMAVLRAMPEGLALLDDEQRVIICNTGFVSMFRARESQILRPDGVQPAHAQEFLRTIEETRKKGRVTSREVRLTTTPPRDLLVTFTPYSDSLIRSGVILTATDITTQKQVENLRSEFVANVSHELRTPLAAIRGYVETCLEESQEGGQPPYRRFLGVIHTHAQRLNALIEDLLVLSRIESKGMGLTMEPIQVYPAVEHAIDTLVSSANKKQIVIVNAVPPLLPDVFADRNSVERVLLNLLENAIKYSPEGTEVRITGRVQSESICLVVEDQGPGIAREHQERIFERFYRVDKARSRAAGGTGLGLSIVKHLVQSHGGEVWVDSESGRGSTFFFTLPIAHATREASRVPVASA